MREPTSASRAGPESRLVPDDYAELHRGFVEQAEAFRDRAKRAEAENRSLRAENDRLRGEIDRMAAHACLRRLTIKALGRERDERDAEAEILRTHLRLVCADAADVAPFASVQRARELLAVGRPCAPCAAGVPGSCRDLFGDGPGPATAEPAPWTREQIDRILAEEREAPC